MVLVVLLGRAGPGVGSRLLPVMMGGVFFGALVFVFEVVLCGFEGEGRGKVMGFVFAGVFFLVFVEVFAFALDVFRGGFHRKGVVKGVMLGVGTRGLAGELGFKGSFGGRVDPAGS